MEKTVTTLEELDKAIDSFDKLTEVEITTDLAKMQEDGLLRKAEEFSDEAFMALVKNRMIDINAEDITITCNAYMGKNTEHTENVGVTVHRSGDIFTVDYVRPFAFLSLYFKDDVLKRACAKYTGEEEYRLYVQLCMRELMWSMTPSTIL